MLRGFFCPRFALLAVISGLSSTLNAASLPAYNADITQTSSSGISSGSYMAGQFHVTYSDVMLGVGLVAGGPFYCAQGSVTDALNRCMADYMGLPSATTLFDKARSFESRGEIDALSNLKSDKIYIFSGKSDNTVKQSVANTVDDWYLKAGVPTSHIKYINSLNAGHAMPTNQYGNSCSSTQSPYINNCNYDSAAEILKHIYGDLNSPNTQLTGRMRDFSQSEFTSGSASSISMANTGYLYVPASCEAGEACKVHVVFHGCEQFTAKIGDQFYQHAGYNRWADSNHIILLYPQATDGSGNPKGCWDWWGYGSSYYYGNRGPQMDAVWRMLQRVTSGVKTSAQPTDTTQDEAPASEESSDTNADTAPVYETEVNTTTVETQPLACNEVSASNYSHVMTDRAHVCGYFNMYACANGSNESLGYFNLYTYTTLKFENGGYSKGNCATESNSSTTTSTSLYWWW